jgi:hypothetical protein
VEKPHVHLLEPVTLQAYLVKQSLLTGKVSAVHVVGIKSPEKVKTKLLLYTA